MQHDPADERRGGQRLVLGLGTGRCGTHALAQLLDRQGDARVTHEEPPLLPWRRREGQAAITARLARWRRERRERLIGDVASFYLPYVEEALEAEPELRVVCLRRPREEVVASFCRWLDAIFPLPMNFWAESPRDPWGHDPIWTRIFPQYDLQDREAGIRRYWDEYYQTAQDLAARFPERFRIFTTDEALNSEAGQRAVLAFAGVPHERQVLAVGMRTHAVDDVDSPRRVHGNDPEPHSQPRSAEVGEPRDNVAELTDWSLAERVTHNGCVVLVPYSTQIVANCERGLKELERRGYMVRRVRGYANIDQARNQMATDALWQGFQETMWIDSDVGFDPDAVERLRAHRRPIVCGVYPQKGRRALACHLLPGTTKLVFGPGGGLEEILYAGTGFLLVRREVYLRMQRRLDLPVCNERFGRPMVPYFLPLTVRSDEADWYLGEDYAFCERARQCGYSIWADTTLRLWHVGQYAYGWEDAGLAPQRYGSFTYHVE